MPFEIHNEIADADGPLKDWITTTEVKNTLILPEEVDQGLFNQVLDNAYAPNLKDDELEEAGQDPFLDCLWSNGSGTSHCHQRNFQTHEETWQTQGARCLQHHGYSVCNRL